MPQILANDDNLVLAYEVAPSGEDYAIIKFIRPRAHYFGSPSDETVSGHPLAQRGLGPYGVFEVRNSSWIRALEQMNRVHPNHNASRFGALRHFVFTFHDNMFECVAHGTVLAAKFSNEVETVKKTSKSDGKPFEAKPVARPEIPTELNISLPVGPSSWLLPVRVSAAWLHRGYNQ